MAPRIENASIAARLERVADLLEQQGANQFRVQAWRGGAATVRRSPESVAEILSREGLDGLVRLPGIGDRLARAIREIVETGNLATLDRLMGHADPLAALASVVGVGHKLAQRIHDELAITTLEELETAAHDGRLARVPGFGPKRLRGIQEALSSRLRTRRRAFAPPDQDPSVAELLDVDREYRERVDEGTLSKIVPRRFNPNRERWLPVFHTLRGEHHYTALFSNTARAHQLGRTRDWVVLYLDKDGGDRQWTVVTEVEGPIRGKRVVRGREAECQRHYA